MSDPFENRPFPRGALIGAAALIGFALLSTVAVRLGGLGAAVATPAPAVESRALRFTDRADGSVAVYGEATGQPVAVLEPGSNGFIRGVLRGLARERRRRGIGGETPFLLSRRADRGLVLEDPATGRVIDLKAFGPTNAEAFDRLLRVGRPASPLQSRLPGV